jgi:transitional endoplasmic reticulum ATPase
MTARKPSTLQASPSKIRLWILRILVRLSGHRNFVQRQGFSSDSLATALDLSEWLDTDSVVFDVAAIEKRLRTLHRAAERDAHDACFSS